MSQSSVVAPAVRPASTGIDSARLPAHGKVRFAAIDGLRGIACLGVLVFHCWISFQKPQWPALRIGSHHPGLSQIYDRGYGGVDLFFVLSGFCLSYPILSKRKNTVNWGKYFVARVRRIVPAYWAALFMFGALSLLIRNTPAQAWFQTDLHWPGWRTFVVDGMLFWKQTLAGPLWTLVLEWRWYFLFPLCVVLCRRTNGWVVLAASIPFSAMSMYLKFGLDRPEWVGWSEGVFRYLPLFGYGILSCDLATRPGRNSLERFLVRNARWGLLVFLVILFLTPAYAEEMHSWPGSIHRMTTFGPIAFFATIAGVKDPLVERLLSWRPLVWVGTFSYSLYLIHAPFVLAAGWFALFRIHSHIATHLLYLVVTPAAMILGAFLFFLAFERPFLARKPMLHASTVSEGTAPNAATLPEAAAP